MSKHRSLVPGLVACLASLTACEVGPEDGELDELAADELPAEIRSATVDLGAGPVEIEFEVVAGMAVLDGDIVLGPVERVERGDYRIGDAAGALNEGVAYAALSHLNSWPGGRIPFVIDGTTFPVGSARRAVVDAAIAHWNGNTIVRLVPHQANAIEHFVRFVDAAEDMGSREGRSGVGFMPGTAQQIELGAEVATRTVIHEIGHTVGFFHEQSRTDRDQFVLINWDNVRDDRVGNFLTYAVSGLVGLDFGPYDLGSIMHYGSFTFADDSDVPTIVRKISGCTRTSTTAACLITAPAGLSPLDRKGATRQVSGDPALKHRLRNEATGQCLRPSGGSTTAGAAVVLDTCSNTASRRWFEYARAGTATPMWINEGSRLCLATNASNQMIQADCDGAAAQRFTTADATGFFNGDFVKRGTACLARVTGSTRPVMSASCSNDANRRWFKDLL